MPIQIVDAFSNSDFARRQTGLLFNLPVPNEQAVQLPEGISLCMIVKNEERFLGACLESVKGVVDEINIVDTGSTDRTVEIARSYGAKIEFREWRNDFAWARNESLALATRRWTLVLDADEEVAAESIVQLRSLRAVPAGLTAVYLNIVNIVDDPTGTGTMSHRLVRIFPTSGALRYKGVIHECLTYDAGELATVLSPIKVVHKGYTSEILIAKDKGERNRPLISRAYEENSDDSFALFNFGNAAICGGDPDAGVAALEKMLDNAVGVRLYFPLAYLMLGQTYCEVYGDNVKALQWLDKGVEAFPKDAGILLTRGQVLAKLNRLAEARAALEYALSQREAMAFTVMTDEEMFEWKLYVALAGTYEREGNYEKAVEYMDAALLNKPASIHLQRSKARLLEKLGRFFDAEVVFRAMSQADANLGRVEHVNFLLRRKRYAQAIAIVENDMDPDSKSDVVADLNIAAARAMMALNGDDPVPFLEAALRRSPGTGPAYTLLEQVYTERGDEAALERLHDEELRAPCARPDDFARRSYRLLALDRNDDARDIADIGLKIDPNSPELRFNSAIASMRLGDDTRAAHEFGRVAETSSHVFPDAMQLRASLLVKNGSAQQAIETLERWIAVASDPVEAVLKGAQVLLGGARPQARALLEAHADADQRVALELAGMLLQDGDIAGAGRIAERALR